jgi:predicted CXXCH cytochrome family protein
MGFPRFAWSVVAALTAGISAAVLVLAVGLAQGDATRPSAEAPGPGGMGALASAASADYVGSAACASCHAGEAKAWRASQHAKAMAIVGPETVLGDFGDVTVEHRGSKARFYRDGPRYMVETEGRDGKTAAFEVTHTFGVAPLQQYLVTFPDGRLQALPFAFDTRPKDKGGQRWFHLNPDQPMPSSDPLHWTRSQQNWNFMCAECHSTDVRKGYDAATDTYHTTFSEISVGCESCHGAGAGHAAWAAKGADPKVAGKGFGTVAAPRPTPDWTPDPSTGSPARGVARQPGDEVETCARCHARRGTLSEDWHPGRPLTDTHMPSLLSEGLFEDDGQMRDEVFNDHLFKQRLMYAKGVVCSDCHDPHSAKLKADGAQVCAQCHLPERFATPAHTGHPPGKSGEKTPDCISCHMPARTYMVVDPRHDHSFRIPRPDLSVAFGTPNACTDCHADKPASWAAAAVERWHGPNRKGHQTWTEAVHRARAGEPAARDMLLKLAAEPTVPGIAKATILSELRRFPSLATETAATKALADPDPMVRIAALRSLAGAPLETRWRRASDLLADPVAAVRMEAAILVADQPLAGLPEGEKTRLEAAFAAYEAAQRLNADRPEGRANLANFLLRRGQPAAAEAQLRAGLALEPEATPLAVNLADLYRAQGREAEAEQVLRQAIAVAPQAAAPRYALGLALIRQRRYADALEQLAAAAKLAPEDARYAYVLAVALQSTGQAAEARQVVAEALKRNPYDPQLLTLALQDAMQARDAARAGPLAQKLSEMNPDDPEIARLAARLRRP